VIFWRINLIFQSHEYNKYKTVLFPKRFLEEAKVVFFLRDPGFALIDVAGDPRFDRRNKKRQVTYIAPLNHLPLLPSGPGGIQQELVV